MRLLTNSMATVARRCFQELEYRYVLCRRPASTRDMDIGTVWHTARDRWILSIDRGDRGLAATAGSGAIIVSNLGSFDKSMLHALMFGYHLRWRDEQAAQYSAKSVEKPFHLPLLNPDTGGRSRTWDRAGKRDVVLYDHDAGQTVFMESKTTSMDISSASTYIRKLTLDSQVSMYADVDGNEPTVCIYDIVRKPGIKPLKATPSDKLKMTQGKNPRPYKSQRLADETPTEFEARCLEEIAKDPAAFYQRITVTRTREQMDSHRRDLWALGVRMREAMRAGHYPRNTDACMRFRRMCAYHDVCAGTTSLDSARFTTTRPHEELDDTAQTTIGFDELAAA